jgi:hypothetical protein
VSQIVPGGELGKVSCHFCLSKTGVVSFLTGLQGFSPKALKESSFFTNTEKLKAQLLQIQTELNNSKQEYEEFKELTR